MSEDYVSNEPCKEKVFGAIEAKSVGEKLQIIKENIQLKGHILWFNKVLYTNGLVWEYYEFIPNKDQSHKIEELQKKTYEWNKDKKEDSKYYKWDNKDLDLLNSLNKLEPKRISLTNGKNIDGDYNWDNNAWRKLLRELSVIDWGNSNFLELR